MLESSYSLCTELVALLLCASISVVFIRFTVLDNSLAASPCRFGFLHQTTQSRHHLTLGLVCYLTCLEAFETGHLLFSDIIGSSN